ncbi:hypothetical protein ABMA32_03955 [Mesorhizobium sp. VNQ89]|uniref:hypothetical protein n=1 Tax=Mesorhizobium quangtriensis TaxID=3157709 RepID=UPI0032B822F1
MKPYDRLDRHALVMAIWTPSAFVAATLLHRGLSSGGAWWIFSGFAVIIAAFVAHIIANAVLGKGFTTGERALGIVAFAASVLALLLAVLVGPPGLGARIFLPVGLGLISLVVAVVAYLVIAFGARGAFEQFDVVRDNNLRPASRLPHRGGRR